MMARGLVAIAIILIAIVVWRWVRDRGVRPLAVNDASQRFEVNPMAICAIHKDGSVNITLATQDIGPGARTVALVVASKTLGFLPLDRIRVQIGDTSFPPSGTSGGSGTTGMVTGQVRNAVRLATQQLLELVAPAMSLPANQLEVSLGKVQPRGRPDAGIPWDEACKRIGDVLMAVAPSGVDWNKPIYGEEAAA